MRLALPLAVLLALLSFPAASSAKTVRCDIGYYAPGLDHGKPAVSKLRAVDLPRRTDGYAPRCLVAESVASEVKRGIQDTGERPARVRVYGARWSGGRWNCGYDGAATTCRKAGKPSRKVKFRLGG
ncbi:MAG: hypothetical protein ABW081_03355 [Solirubrobacteraceae bacterium]